MDSSRSAESSPWLTRVAGRVTIVNQNSSMDLTTLTNSPNRIGLEIVKAESAPTICGRFFSKVAIVGASAQLTSVAPGEPAVAGGRDREEDAAISVLLIEDNEGDAYLVSESLANSEPRRFKITHRDRLSSGLACLSNESFDLVLVDLSLPDSDGFETFRRVRESSPSIPIVVLTGRDDLDLAIKTAREGGQDYLLKQFTGGELLKRLMCQAIERKRIIEEALKEAETRRNEFLAMLAHELRNPLAALDCGLSLLGSGRPRERPRVGLDDGRAPGATPGSHGRGSAGHLADHARHIPTAEGAGAARRVDRASR